MLKKVFLPILIVSFVIVIMFMKFGPNMVKMVTSIARTIMQQDIIKKSADGHTNILLLGTGGGSHEGANLTDTIIFMSINHRTKQVNVITLPRDLWIPAYHDKINAVYADAIVSDKSSALQKTKDMVGELMGQPIQYGFRINFDGFVKAVDEVGGIDVSVERTFDDYQYPITGKENDSCGHTSTEINGYTASQSAQLSDLEFFPCRFEHLHFDKGTMHMDGILSLKYVRSRHALGPEGSDFARSKRQSQAIQAFKEKIFSVDTLINPSKVTALLAIIKDSIDTDITEDEYIAFAQLAQQLKETKILSNVIDEGTAIEPGLLENPPISNDYNLAWVLIPHAGTGNYTEIQKYVRCLLTYGECSTAGKPSPPVQSVTPKP